MPRVRTTVASRQTWANPIIRPAAYQRPMPKCRETLGLSAAALLLGLMASTIGAVHLTHPQEQLGASGMSGGASARSAWMVSVSMNCNNRDVCTGELFLGQPFQVGGLWGSIRLFEGGTGVGQFTACL